MEVRAGTRANRPRYSTPRLAAAESRALDLVGHCEDCYRLVWATVVDGNLAGELCSTCGREAAGRAMAVRFLAAAFGGG